MGQVTKSTVPPSDALLWIDWLWMPGSPGRTHRVRWCATCVVTYNLPPPRAQSIDIWLNLRGWSLPECFSSSVGSFTSTLNVRVEGTSTLRGMHTP